jgi:glutamate-ammonia-ligase adenylyltransferase
MTDWSGALANLPPALRDNTRLALDACADAAVAGLLAKAPDEIRASLPRVFAASEFIAHSCVRDAQLFQELLQPGRLRTSIEPADLRRSIEECRDATDEATLMQRLRRARRRELVRIAWRDLAGWASPEETLKDLSAFADAAIAVACAYAERELSQRHGIPRSSEREPQSLVVLGMGKLGGRELNFSSDIDLVFLFDEAGETDGARPIDNEEFFTRVGRTLIRVLDALTADGFVFRVDMRLRPFGESGPLVVNFGFFESYLQQHGRDWERYAYVKARALTAPDVYERLYDDAVRPFVYRRYLDFGVFESLRAMKALIARDVARREVQENVKLGPGGIREIEFIVQAFQLLRGGSDRRLQSQSLLAVLPLLCGEKLLPAAVVADLSAAYRFLRQLENRLQMLADEQTHDLPEDELRRARLGLAMGAGTWERLLAELDRHRAAVTRHFQSILFGPAGAPMQSVALAFDLESLWDPAKRRPALREALERIGFSPAEEAATLLANWLESSAVQRLDDGGLKRLQTLIPRLLESARHAGDGITALRRVLLILEAVGGRSAYLALLNENRPALTRLVSICERSEFLARQIARFPLLLDELIDARILEEPPTRAQFARELSLRRERAPDADPERQVESLRHFQRAAVFRVALADLTGRLPLMQVSDRLTDIAELILEESFAMAWQQLTQAYGVPQCGDGSALRPTSVAIVGYGKLGGIELGYGSDLDLVFLHDSAGEIQRTGGAKPLDNAVFFLRLGQRIVHLLTLHSAAGRLYDVDMRLRPSGKGGLMVTQVAAFENYQRAEAWTWEHQALLRARAVAGASDLRKRFEAIRLDVLCHHVRRDTLKEEVRKMRERMRGELSKAKAGQFDVKQDPGGIADIEFLAQYWALAWADRYPPLVTFSDTIRQLESVASADLVPQATVDVLTRIYRAYRSEIHHRSLENAPAVVDAGEFSAERAAVVAVWNDVMTER